LGITFSVALHEFGHMWAAKATGMKVRRYFIGFGPRLFSFRRGETEYGLKALPLGGFCDIAGMTAVDELEPDEVERAMYRQKTWKRLTVMFAGIGMNFVLGFVLIVITAIAFGLPNLHNPPTEALLGPMSCVGTQQADGSMAPCTGAGPAQQAGLRQGDVVTAVAGIPVATWSDFVEQTQKQTGPFQYTVRRDGHTMTLTVNPRLVTRLVKDSDNKQSLRTVAAVGVGQGWYPDVHYSLPAAIPGALDFTGNLFAKTVEALGQVPGKVGALWHAVTGGERDPNTPMSVVGATIIGGQTVERGMWQTFLLLLASLNFFLGTFNLLPLLPLDGGHAAVAGYEKIRNVLRGRRGLAPGGPVDYLKLMPFTYAVVVVGGLYMLLTLTADIVNPIKL
jgi:membrane-associated protease RseP (regulator of RpoE activity)